MVDVTWITPFAPDRSGGGGQIRQAHLLLALAARAQVTLICPGPVRDDDVRAAVTRLVEVAPSPSDWRGRHSWWRRAADLAASVAPRQPIEVRAFRSVRRTLGPALQSSLTGGAPADVVLVEFAGLAPLLAGWSSAPGHAVGHAEGDGKPTAWVLTLHNLPSRMSAQQASILPRRRQRWLLYRDAKVAAAFERRAATAFDAVITCTEEDATELAGAGRVLVVPNGVDTERFQPTPLPNSRRIVFTGALYTTPNVDGARWFCEQVLPLVQAEEPSAHVDLVGAAPVPEVNALGALPGVSVHADVPTVEPFLQAARVAVVPIRIGSGTRLKALEALAAGRPVVGTTIGLEGLGLRPGQHALVADESGAFADAVVALLRDEQLAATLAAAGRAEVEQRFAWPAIAAAFAESMVTLAETKGGAKDGGADGRPM